MVKTYASRDGGPGSNPVAEAQSSSSSYAADINIKKNLFLYRKC